MKFAATFALSALLCADIAIGAVPADPREAKREARREARRLARRANNERRTHPKISSTLESNVSFVEYSTNWAGAVLIGTGYTSVTGTVVAPTVSGASDDSGSAWVGIDGDTCQTAILQTGIDWYGDGSYDAWYEWYPDYAEYFSLTISEGDSVKMTVTATSKTGGSAVVQNLSTGKSASKTFSGVTSGTLCEYNAEWIVEDFSECTGSSCTLVPFADFGTVEFTGCAATKSGASVTTSGATILDIEQDGEILTDCSASGSTVTCTYTG